MCDVIYESSLLESKMQKFAVYNWHFKLHQNWPLKWSSFCEVFYKDIFFVDHRKKWTFNQPADKALGDNWVANQLKKTVLL